MRNLLRMVGVTGMAWFLHRVWSAGSSTIEGGPDSATGMRALLIGLGLALLAASLWPLVRSLVRRWAQRARVEQRDWIENREGWSPSGSDQDTAWVVGEGCSQHHAHGDAAAKREALIGIRPWSEVSELVDQEVMSP